MDDGQLVRDLERLARAAVDSSEHPGAETKRRLAPAMAAVAAVVALMSGGVFLAASRHESVTDVSTRPGATNPALTTPDTSPGTTVDQWGYPADLPGRELFRHRSVDGHAVLVGRLVTVPDDCTQPAVEWLCQQGQRPGTSLMIDSIIDGDYVGGGGGPVPTVWDPAVAITKNSNGGGGRPGHERVHVVYATGPATAAVQIDVRLLDGTVVTDSMTPVSGVVAFSAPNYEDFVGPARAYDSAGTLLATATSR